MLPQVVLALAVPLAPQVVVNHTAVAVVDGRGQVFVWRTELDEPPPAPRRIEGLSGVQQVAVLHYGEGCALLGGGGVRCFAAEPLEELQLERGVRQIVATRESFCALHEGGEVSCWGANDCGQLGNGQVTSSGPLGKVRGLAGVVELAPGAEHVCARKASGQVWCWGSGTSVGDGEHHRVDGHDRAAAPAPVRVRGLDDAALIAGGSNASDVCAVRRSGEVVCWGTGHGALVDDDTDRARLPRRVAGVDKPVALSIGVNTACATDGAGAVRCWGEVFRWGPALRATEPPYRVDFLKAVTQVAIGFEESCALLRDGAPVCFGSVRGPRLDPIRLEGRR